LNLRECSYSDGEDYWRVRAFLRDVYLLNDRRERSWQVYRFDYWRSHGVANLGHGRLERDVVLWESEEGEVAAVLNSEGRGHAHLQVHPGFRSPRLEEEMIRVAEERLAVGTAQGRRKLQVWTGELDELRQGILAGRGYDRGSEPEYQRRRSLSTAIPESPLPEGYEIRALGGVSDLPARSYVSWRAFHPYDPDDEYEGWEWYRNVQRAPLYRRDLDIVAVAPSGEFASFCTVWFDDVTRTGAFEPVGTAPEHQRRGLGKAVMCEGLRRLKARGAILATVGSYGPAAHALYDSVGFTDYDLAEPWVKEM
jgi:ribosomal protein S18 acetylase RimI-like enzyme